MPPAAQTRLILAAVVALGVAGCSRDRDRPRRPRFSIAAGMSLTCISDEEGVLRCWGQNSQGGVGDGTTEDRLEPVVILERVVQVVGDDHMCALMTDGEVRCWGDGSWGRLGDGTRERRTRPTPVVGLPKIAAIAASGTRSCALGREGAVFCWGREPELGRRPERDVLRPERVRLPRAVEIGVGYAHACARTPEGEVLCWGRNNWGQLGDGTVEDRARPAKVPRLRAVELAVGSFHSCARLEDGTVRCWGMNMDVGEQMNPREYDMIGRRPRQVANLSGAVQVVAGGHHACARTRAGTISCWGSNEDGQLGGDVGIIAYHVAREVTGVSGATFVAAGSWRTCVRLADGSVPCWGRTFLGRDAVRVRSEIVSPPGAR